MKLEVELIRVEENTYADVYIISFGHMVAEIVARTQTLYSFKKDQVTFYRDINLFNPNNEVDNLQDYFSDWKNPTEEELVAFCLEHDIMY